MADAARRLSEDPRSTSVMLTVLFVTLLGVWSTSTEAAAQSICGNGTVESGEDCDDGNAIGGDCCSATCQYEVAGASCNDDADLCTIDECDGAGSCVIGLGNVTCDAPHPVCGGGAFCNSGTGACDPLPGVPAGTSCEDDGDLCTIDECDGAGNCVLASEVSCQLPDECDGGQSCSPGTGACVANPDAASGTPCNLDADQCTVDECDGSGSCVAGALLDCDDGDACTADSCDAITGCANDPIPGCEAAVPSVAPMGLALLTVQVLVVGGIALWRKRRPDS